MADSYTKLLLHCNGIDESTTFTDNGVSAHTISVTGNAQIDTAQNKFGGASGLFDGAGDYLSVPDHTDWDFGTGDWTIDFWVRFNGNPAGTYQGFCGRDSGGGSYFYTAYENGSLRFRDLGGSGGNVSITWIPSADTWYHIAYVRNGSTMTIYVDGTSIGSGSASTMLDRSVPLFVGTSFAGNYYLNGWIDEFRISKGVARWTSNFTPSTGEYNGETEVLVDIDTDIRAKHSKNIEDIDVDIRAVAINLEDINTDIRIQYNPVEEDIDTDIRIAKLILDDIETDIRIQHNPVVEDIDTDIRIGLENLKDLDIDIRVLEAIIEDIDTDIRIRAFSFKDIDVHIAAVNLNISDISSDIRVTNKINRSLVDISEIFSEEGIYLSSNTVTLNLSRVYGALNMQFRNEDEIDFSSLEAFTIEKIHNLSTGDGNKKVYFRFQDITGVFTNGEDFINLIVATSQASAVTIEAYEEEDTINPITESTYQDINNPFFRWKIPDYSIPYDGFSISIDDTPGDTITVGIPDVVITGIEISKATPLPEMTIHTTLGSYYYSNILKDYQSQDITLDDGGAQDRIDLVYIDSGTLSLNIIKGTEAVTPEIPELPSEGLILATAYVPASETAIVNVTLTDIREFYVNLNKYVKEPLDIGQHIFKVKGFNKNNITSLIAEFNIWVANSSPEMGLLKVYTDNSKVIELANGIYQIADNTPYIEWTAAPTQPGPITYYYTTDGSEPDTLSNNTTNTYLNLGPFSEGITTIKVRPYDSTSGNYGTTRQFIFIYGSQTFTDDIAVVSGSLILKQSNKEVEVKSISWNFDSARICKIYQPLDFDVTTQLSVGDDVSVVIGASNSTIFKGIVKRIERTIDIGSEGITYECIGPRGSLNECYATIDDPDFGETAQIVFEDESIGSAITTIVSKAPEYIKNIDSLPSGANVSDEFIGLTISGVLNRLYSRTKFGWYINPEGSLISVDNSVNNPGQAKFGVYGTTVNSLNPQYNVISANLQFDINKRYNKVIIEGARKKEKIRVNARCGASSDEFDKLTSQNDTIDDLKYKVYSIDSKWPVTKILETFVSYSKITKMTIIPFGNIGQPSSWTIVLTSWDICKDNKITSRGYTPVYNTGLLEANEAVVGENYANKETETDAKNAITNRQIIGYSSSPEVTIGEEIQGSLGVNNTIRFAKAMYNYWTSDARTATDNGILKIQAGIKTTDAVVGPFMSNLVYYWKNPPKKSCASVSADIIIETEPIKVEVTLSGTASDFSKVLRIVNTEFKYNEDPDNLIDDTARMIEYGEDILEKYKDIKVNGSIILDTIDLSWDLDKTVNLINTQQGSWTTLNAKVIGIFYNIGENTTTLEITSEFLK